MSPGSSYSRLPTPRVARGGALLLVLMISAALAFLPAAVAQEGSSQGSSGAHKEEGPPPNHSTDTSYATYNRETPVREHKGGLPWRHEPNTPSHRR